MGAEDTWWYGYCNPGVRIAVIAPTSNDVRATCFEGVSGLLACTPQMLIEDYNRANQELKFINGTLIRGFTAEKPDRLRGPQFHRAWGDEVAAWPHEDALDQLLFGLRLGQNPQFVVTTTPRNNQLVRRLLNTPGNVATSGNTFDNAKNLAPAALQRLQERYGGTRKGRQELYAELLTDVTGALWTQGMFDSARIDALPEIKRIVVAVDPSGAGTYNAEEADSIGIIVAGEIENPSDPNGPKHAVVLEDATVSGGPAEWGKAAVNAYHRWNADRLVAETNYGGAMVQHVIHSVDSNVSYKQVTATRGKRVRAEPIAAFYEQGRVHHYGLFNDLEDQCCEFTASGFQGKGSPDRTDALVWALTELMFEGAKSPGVILKSKYLKNERAA